jgi:hypothetical protein
VSIRLLSSQRNKQLTSLQQTTIYRPTSKAHREKHLAAGPGAGSCDELVSCKHSPCTFPL